jgi:hypothetical protein
VSKIRLTPNASGTGTVTLTVPSTNTDRTISLPDTAGNVVTTGDTGTITASMLDGGQSGSAPAFAVRAWVSFEGQGTVSIRGSGNVSSITDGGTGTYTVNFTTAFADANYAVTTSSQDRTFHCISNGTVGTSSVQMRTKTPDNTPFDADPIFLMAIR